MSYVATIRVEINTESADWAHIVSERWVARIFDDENVSQVSCGVPNRGRLEEPAEDPS